MNLDDLPATLFLLLTYGLVAASIILWIQLIRRRRRGLDLVTARFRWRPVVVPRVAVAVTLGLLLVAAVALISTSGSEELPTLEQIQLGLQLSLTDGVVFIVVLLAALFLGAKSPTDLPRLGFRTDRIGKQLRDGVYGFVASVVPVGLLLIITSPLRSEATVHPFLRLLKETGWGPELMLIVVTAAVVAPLKEELMFRVVLQTWLEERIAPWIAVLISSLAFAAVHGMPDSLALIPLAVILGYLFQRRRSYLAVVTVHSLFNIYNLVATLVTE